MSDNRYHLVLSAVILALFYLQPASAQSPDKPLPISYLINREFDLQLEKTITASWEGTPLRSLLRRLAENRKIAILLDRHIDPTQKPTIKLQQIPLQDALEQIAKLVDAEISILDNVVYIGPSKRAQILRTLIQQRADEIVGPESTFSRGEQFDLVKLTPLQWIDLSEPKHILDGILQRYALQLEAEQPLPHDLWAAASFPPSDFVQQLSLVLIQFDLTFNFSQDGKSIKLRSIPRQVYISRNYLLKSKLAAKRIRTLMKQQPDWNWDVVGDQVILRGFVEQHEQVARALRPKQATPKPGKTPAPLSQQRFTLKLQNVSAAALFAKLEQSGITIQYNVRQLTVSGVDLEKKINMNVTQVTADEFFNQICSQLNLDFMITDRTVKLSPKP